MDNREHFVNDLLFYTRKGEQKWVPLSSLPKDKRLPIPPNLDKYPAYVTFSGDKDKFTFGIFETIPNKKNYFFIAYVNGAPSFVLQQSELENPYTLKALFDAAAKKTLKDMLQEMKATLEAAGFSVSKPKPPPPNAE